MPQGANDNGSMMSVIDMFQANFRAILDADDIDVNISKTVNCMSSYGMMVSHMMLRDA